jgi:tetratricopeptide (TPR) repeat protein
MNKLDKNIELIERYMRDELSSEEQQELDEKLINDEEFGLLFRDMHTIIPGIRQSASRTSLDEKLERLQAHLYAGAPEEKAEAARPAPERQEAGGGALPWILIIWRKVPARLAYLVLGILLGAAAVFSYLSINRSAEPAALYAQYFEAYPNESPYGIQRSEASEEGPEHRGFRHYDRGEYRQALDQFRQSLENDPENPTILFYSGNASLLLGETERAIGFFEEVLRLRKGWEVPSRWYLALAWLQAGDAARAAPYLQQLAESTGTYREKAMILVRKLE